MHARVFWPCLTPYVQVVGFDMVDDESKPERRPTKHCPAPADWNSKHNCAYSYYAYYIYANLHVLNNLRESRGLNTFTFRPHAGRWGQQARIFFLMHPPQRGVMQAPRRAS